MQYKLSIAPISQKDIKIMKRLSFRGQFIAYIISIVGFPLALLSLTFVGVILVLSLIMLISVSVFAYYTFRYNEQVKNGIKEICKGKIVAKNYHDIAGIYQYQFEFEFENLHSQNRIFQEVTSKIFNHFNVGDTITLHKFGGKYRYGEYI